MYKVLITTIYQGTVSVVVVEFSTATEADSCVRNIHLTNLEYVADAYRHADRLN